MFYCSLDRYLINGVEECVVFGEKSGKWKVKRTDVGRLKKVALMYQRERSELEWALEQLKMERVGRAF